MRAFLLFLFSTILAHSQPAFSIYSPSFIKTGATVASTNLLTDLKGHWKLEEASGTRVDSHSTNNLTASGTLAQVAGKINNACDFQGGNLTITPSVNVDLNPGDFDMTVACWVFFDAVTGEQALISHFSAAGYVVQTSGTNLIYYVDGTGSLDSIQSGQLFAISTWYFVVCWHDSVNDTINIQVNDGTVASKAHSDGIALGGQFMLGNQSASSRPLNGRLDSVSVWKRLLTTAERTSLYNSGNGLDYPF